MLDEIRKQLFTNPLIKESPYHHMSALKVNGKQFCTIKDETTLNIFLDNENAEMAKMAQPDAVSDLFWGKKKQGIILDLNKSDLEFSLQILEIAIKRKTQ